MYRRLRKRRLFFKRRLVYLSYLYYFKYRQGNNINMFNAYLQKSNIIFGTVWEINIFINTDNME